MKTETVPVIAVDGPSGTGKGTVAARVAQVLNFHLLDSGVLYRLLGIAVLKAGIGLDNGQAVAGLAKGLNISFSSAELGTVLLDGEDVSLQIRTEEGSNMASRVGAIPEARSALLERQLGFRKPPGLVADGRDMGTVVFRDAVLKIFLTASLEERAQRRYKQLIDKGIDAKMSILLQELRERDARDSKRKASPMIPAADAFVLDTTDLAESEVASQVMQLVRNAL
ncbi:MAG: (d)CMP kinase [Gammaproteobacteria bacterium]|nr:(d)CMP kinase [Gammaproteobacteria bacterium]